ncbi:MAG: hypothetical protein CL943_00255 [Candidatus Diapherotrites archaeon]|uniref:Uncharacterized protein n=1 Tax=Candidatus Iainarchaeum sp. TaxID=3101447 RepID=A0A2D6LZX0_9ARCH|nr:hypothetical protein [Candidatus Diapherotrites archaeon]
MNNAIKIFGLVFLLCAFLSASAADLSTVKIVRDTGVGVIYVESLYDDDGSIGFVEIFVANLGTVDRYSFENVLPNQELMTVADGDFEGIYYNFMDRDGAVQNIGVFQPIAGIVPSGPPGKPRFRVISSAFLEPRLNGDESAFLIDITANTKPEYDIADILFNYNLSGGKTETSSFLLENDEPNVWTETMGPFTETFFMGGDFRPSPVDTEQRFANLWMHPRWFSYTECTAPADSDTGEPEAGDQGELTALPSEGEKILFKQIGGYSEIDIERKIEDNGNWTLKVKRVNDDDGSIQLVSIHVIVDGVDTTYEIKEATKNDVLIIEDQPADAIAYFNFVDFDGSMINMQTFQVFDEAGVPPTPTINPFASAEFSVTKVDDGLTYLVEYKVVLKQNIDPLSVKLFYTIAGQSHVKLMENTTGKTYVANVGPLAATNTIRAHISAYPTTSDIRYSKQYFYARTLHLLVSSNCPEPSVEVCYNGLDDNGDGQVDEDCDDDDEQMPNEICDNGFDDNENGVIGESDCVEHEDLSEEDPETDTWVLRIEKEKLLVGETQKIWVEDTATGEMVGGVDIVVSGEELTLSTGEQGILEYRVKAERTYQIIATKGAFETTTEFRGLVLVTSVVESLTDIAALLFGSTALENPVSLALVLILAVVAALLVFDRSRLLFEEKVKSTNEKRKETLVRISLAVVAFILPIAGSNVASVYVGIGLAAVEIAAVFLASYFIQQTKKSKAIKV